MNENNDGKISYVELFELVAECEVKFREAARRTIILEVPNRALVEKLLISMYNNYNYSGQD